MPRIAAPNNRIQRAFAPLVLRTCFQVERLLTPPPLPWHVTFPPHVDGIPADDPPPSEREANKAPLIKMTRPAGEPGRKGERGFNLKSTLDLPEGIYDALLGEVHGLAATRLNLALTISNQQLDTLNQIFKELKEKFPILEEKFEGDWPAKALMQIFLKHTSSKSSSATRSK